MAVSHITHRVKSKIQNLKSRRGHASEIQNPDTFIGLILFCAGLYAYTATLAPTVLEGDAALYEYTPYVLGVTYPTGYPLYILLGKLWLTLFPFGELAWRMNLFSAFCSAAALPLLYSATRRLLTPSISSENRPQTADRQPPQDNFIMSDIPRTPDSSPIQNEKFGPTPSLLPHIAALVTVLTFATLPTFWRWSTEAKIYSLNILLFSSVLYTLALASVQRSTFNVQRLTPFALPAFLLGLQIAVHSTTVLLIPGLLLFAWLNFRSQFSNTQPLTPNLKSLLSNLLFLLLPGLLYLYIPLRAEWLIAQYGRDEAIAHGLLADFYHSGLAGLVRYFSAADFTGGVVTNWGLIPQQFVTTYIPILSDELTPLGLGLGVIGGLALALMRPRLFWPLFLLYAMPIPFVLAYGQGEQSAFLLPSLLIFSIFVGHSLILITQLSSHLTSKLKHLMFNILPPLLLLSLIPTLFLPQIRYNLNWLEAKWDRSNYNYWADALAHPLEPGASLLAEWGDLTSFWYLQHAEGRRPDLRGLYPPTGATAANYLSQGSDLYIAGPSSKDWAADIQDRFQLLPWGRLVRLAPKEANPQAILPALPHAHTAIFDQKLRLLGADFASQALDGRPYGVTLTWLTLADLPPETTISLRLTQGDVIAAQLDDTLLSGWFPRPDLPGGQYGLSYAPIPLPLGLLPGKYRLQLVAYTSYKQPWPLADGSTLLDLGEIELALPLVDSPLPTAPLNPTSGYNFNGEIELADYEYTVTRVGQGKGFGLKLLWQAQTKPADNYTLLAELIDPAGNVLRSVKQQPLAGRAPTAGWQPGQFVRDQVDLVLPASTPVGPEAVQVRLSWLRPDGSPLKVRWWLLPMGQSLALNKLDVTEKEDRVFEPPQLQYPIDANLDGKARLLGYNTSLAIEKSGFRWSRRQCAANAETCLVHFDFYWQGLQEMDQLYFVFLHLVDAQGQIVAQQDKAPGIRGKEPTTSWLPGEVIADPIDLSLKPELPPGQYTLRLGMYLPPSEPRLPIFDQAGQSIGDFVEIGAIEVVP